MKKYILIAFISLFLLSSNSVSAGLLITDDMKVPGVNFNGKTTEMTILKDSEAEYFFVSNGAFTVTNPSQNGFNVASSNNEVKTILLTSEDDKVVSCALNDNPGKSYLHISDLKGKYNVVPSTIESCEKALSFNKTFATISSNKIIDSNIVLSSFWDDMSQEQKEKLILEIGKIAVIMLIGQAF
ncbi:MAG TPA: hypothetical protein PKU93_03035 [Candidatus Pacearchaeota archaeon]|nr:hypothetical protein [Candidatus Pacearchaeota archaeon]